MFSRKRRELSIAFSVIFFELILAFIFISSCKLKIVDSYFQFDVEEMEGIDPFENDNSDFMVNGITIFPEIRAMADFVYFVRIAAHSEEVPEKVVVKEMELIVDDIQFFVDENVNEEIIFDHTTQNNTYYGWVTPLELNDKEDITFYNGMVLQLNVTVEVTTEECTVVEEKSFTFLPHNEKRLVMPT